MNHIFVDYENMKSVDPALLAVEETTFTLLLGPQNRSLDVAFVEQLLKRAASVELVRIDKAGRNAVDFALAYYLGRKVLADPTASFYVVSKDTDYQPLIEHLQTRNVRVSRHESFGTVPGLSGTGNKPAPARTAEAPSAKARTPQTAAKAATAGALEPEARVVAHLRRNEKSRPARKATLIRLITTQVLKGTADDEAERLIGRLEKRGYLSINEKGAVTYLLEARA